MKYNFLSLSLAISIGIFGTACAKPKSTGNDSLVYEVVKELSSDAYKGRMSGTPENLQAAEYIAGVYKKMGLQPAVGNSFLVPFVMDGDTLYNVCAVIKGRVDSFYAFGAHFDHIGHDDLGSDKVFNGADDNASGVAAMIGIANVLKAKQPEYSVLLMAFNAEEVGLLGSNALVEQAEMDQLLNRTLVLFNMEMVGTVAASGKNSLFMTGDNMSNLFELLNSNAQGKLTVVKDPYPQHQLFFRSDNVGFYERGIVAHSLSTCDMDNTNHYHQKHDEISIINFENLNQIVQNFSATISTMMNNKNVRFKYK